MKLFLVLFFSISVFANDKDQYSLFHPTPKNEMRQFVTDRPNRTESPISVDAGHFQFETDLWNQTKDDNIKVTNFNNINLKVGLTNSIDLQLVSANYVYRKDKSETKKGFGDTILRLKKNLIGNDGGDFSFALLPYVKIPTAGAGLSNDHLEGGLSLPFAFTLPKGWSMGSMFQIDHLRNNENTGWMTNYFMSWAFSHAVIGDLSGFFELFNQFSDDKEAGSNATLNLGFTYMLKKNIQLDAGYFIGMTNAANDSTSFLGLSALY